MERQVAKAVRIQLRGQVLNSVGVYNRSKLTRLVINKEWDNKVYEENWKKKTWKEKMLSELTESAGTYLENEGQKDQSSKRQSDGKMDNSRASKRRKLGETIDEPVWGKPFGKMSRI